MDRDPSRPTVARMRVLLHAADQATVAFLVGACFLTIVLHGCWQATFRQQRIEFDRAPPLQVDFQIDVNTADWPEFTLLPRIGETLARRIVAHRAQHGPFRTVDQLAEVKGIGPKTLRRMRPYLRVGSTREGDEMNGMNGMRTADAGTAD
jgi:competence ComEA-like helix-hairpin-helix protein